MRAAADREFLESVLRREPAPAEVVATLANLTANAGASTGDVACYSILQTLLGATTVEEIGRLTIGAPPPLEGLAFADFIAGCAAYMRQRYTDRFGEFGTLRLNDFEAVRHAWRELRRQLLDQEQPLFRYLARVWDAAMDREQHGELLRDLAEILLEHAAERAYPREAYAWFDTFVRSVFVRLVLAFEPDVAALVTQSGIRWYDRAQHTIIEANEKQWPEWLPRNVTVATLRETFATEAHAGIWWEFLSSGDETLDTGSSASIVIGWSTDAPSNRRFEDERVQWALLLDGAVRHLRVSTVSGRLFSMVAHNLGAPVFKLISDSHILVDRFPEIEQNEDARFAKYNQILKEARYMQGIIDAILSIDGREPNLNLRDVSLASLVYDVVRTQRLDARASRNVTIHYDKPEDAMIAKTKFITDEARLYDIMLNLVSNAVKYSPVGGMVRVTTSVGPRGALLTVHDDGPDVPDDERNLIFQPFFRGRAAAKTQGFGLGLYVADLYARALKGRISISHVPGEGKSFVVFLPHYEADRAHSDHR